MKLIRFLALFVAPTLPASAAIRSEIVEHQQGDTVLEGCVAFEDSVSGQRPGVLIVHQWKGLDAYEQADHRSCEAMRVFLNELFK